MSTEKAASQIRAELMEAQAAYRRCQYPDLQAEAIAKHYAVHAKVALELLRLFDAKRCCAETPAVDECIEMLIEQIKTNHLRDFGIALEWNTLPEFVNPQRHD